MRPATDVGWPGGLNSRQMADAARIERPDLKVLIVTGYAESPVIGEAQLEAGLEIMTKPFQIDALSMRVDGLLK